MTIRLGEWSEAGERDPEMQKRMGPCPHCGLRIILTGHGSLPCSYCGKPLPKDAA